MSERDAGVGSFMLGVAVGAMLGLFFAPAAGARTRTVVARRVRRLRELAEDKAGEVRDLLAAGDEDDEGGGEDAGEANAGAGGPSAREELRRRLAEARERRRDARAARRGPSLRARTEEDDPAT